MAAKAREREIDRHLREDRPMFGPLPPYGMPGPPIDADTCSACWGPQQVWYGNTWGLRHRTDGPCTWHRGPVGVMDEDAEWPAEWCDCHRGDVLVAPIAWGAAAG